MFPVSAVIRKCVFHIFVLFVGDFGTEKACKQSDEVLSHVPKCKKVFVCLMEKIHVIDKLHSA